MAAASAGPLTVLVVEDEQLIADMLASILPDHDMTVRIVTENFPTLLTPRAWDGVDVAVVDFMLGPISGDSILKWLKHHRPHIRRVLFSAVTNLNIVPHELFDAQVLKPASVTELVEAIRG